MLAADGVTVPPAHIGRVLAACAIEERAAYAVEALEAPRLRNPSGAASLLPAPGTTS